MIFLKQKQNAEALTNGTPLLTSNQAHQHSNESVDLDNLFAFLSEVQPGCNANAIFDEIGEKMDNLVDDLDEELESVIQQEIEGLTNERNLLTTNLKNIMSNNSKLQSQVHSKIG